MQAKFGRWLQIMHQHCIDHATEVSAADWQVVHEVAIAVSDILDGSMNIIGVMHRDILFPVRGHCDQSFVA